MEMLATGTTCSLNHSVTTTTPALVAASIEPQADARHPAGLRQGAALQDAGQSAPSAEPRRGAGGVRGGGAALGRQRTTGCVRFGMAIEFERPLGRRRHEHRGADLPRLRAGQAARAASITAHISGGTFSLEKGFLKYLRETGRTDVRYLMQLGILDPHWILIHGIHVTELDIEHMARVGCSFVYTPTSESMRGGGIGPFANAQRAGVNVALGTDGPMVDYSVDMVEQMKVCALMQHVRHLDPTRMPVERALEMATINAAKALGLEHEIGSLEAGKRADIAIFDLRKPYVGVLHRPLSSFVSAGKGSDARAVLVDGEIVYRDGTFTHLAESCEVIGEAERDGRAVLDKAGLSHRLTPAWRM